MLLKKITSSFFLKTGGALDKNSPFISNKKSVEAETKRCIASGEFIRRKYEKIGKEIESGQKYWPSPL